MPRCHSLLAEVFNGTVLDNGAQKYSCSTSSNFDVFLFRISIQRSTEFHHEHRQARHEGRLRRHDHWDPG